MKPDAAPVRIKNGIGEQMVEIDSHREHKDQPRFFPGFPVKSKGDQPGKQEVKRIMNDVFQRMVTSADSRYSCWSASGKGKNLR